MIIITIDDASENTQRVNRIIDLLKSSVTLLIGTPMILVPVVIGGIAVMIFDFIDIFAVDPFDWFWVGDLSHYGFFTIILSFLHVFVSAVLFNLTALATLDIAQKVLLKQDYSIQDSFRLVSVNLVNYAIIALLCQLCIFTYVLTPLGITIMIVAVVDSSDVMTIISKSVTFLQENLVEIIMISILWMLSRYILFKIPGGLTFQTIPDVIIGLSVLKIYLEY